MEICKGCGKPITPQEELEWLSVDGLVEPFHAKERWNIDSCAYQQRQKKNQYNFQLQDDFLR